MLLVVALGMSAASATKYILATGSDSNSKTNNASVQVPSNTGTSKNNNAESSLPNAAPWFQDQAASLGITFEHDCGAQGQYYIPEEIGSGGAWLDYDNDGDLDLYLVQGGSLTETPNQKRNQLFRNDGEIGFTNVSSESRADIPGHGMGAYAADIDNDGDVDLFVTRVGSNVLLQNNGDSTFTDISQQAGIDDPGFGTGAAFFDYDNDGFLDLYVTNYLAWAPEIEVPCYGPAGVRDYCNPIDYKAPVEDLLYRNRGDGTFQNTTQQAGMAGALGHGLGVVAGDFTSDGRLDLYVANDQNPAFFWVNQGDGTFVDDAAFAGCAFNSDGIAIAGMGVVCEDFDNDLDFDILVTNIHDQAHLALRNTNGTFDDVSRIWGLDGWGVPYTGFGIAVFDRDNDGILEGLVANGAVNIQHETVRPGHPYAEPNQFVVRDASGKFKDASKQAGFPFGNYEMSRGVIVGDYNNDGRIDAVISNNRGPARLLVNREQDPGNWITLDVRIADGSRHAINAVVTIEADNTKTIRSVRPHVGYLSSNDPRVHVGLGDAQSASRVEVRFTDGRSQVWQDLPANNIVRLQPGQEPRVVGKGD